MKFKTVFGYQVIATRHLVPKTDSAANHYVKPHQSSPALCTCCALLNSFFSLRAVFRVI